MTPPLLVAASGVTGVLVAIHQRLGYALLAVLAIGLVLSLLAVRSPHHLPTVRAYLWLSFAALSVQAALGIALAIAGQRPADGLHFIYGPVSWVALPVALLCARGGSARREAWILTLGFLVAFLLVVRALMTG